MILAGYNIMKIEYLLHDAKNQASVFIEIMSNPEKRGRKEVRKQPYETEGTRPFYCPKPAWVCDSFLDT
jgi:hypothetical protein